ncbi:MAG: ribosome-associated translation inhibitor RaiA [Chloroflexi bacterium]|nr:ribosome-associated translation inhibitor RaiA [Chloroflexota bacterium]
MEIQIHTRNLEATDEVREYIERKLAPLGRHLREPATVRVELRRERTRASQDQMVVQLTLTLNDTVLRAEERALTVVAAVDAAADALDRQVLRYKGRHYRNLRAKGLGRGASVRSAAPSPAPGAEEEMPAEPEGDDAPGNLVRVKRFALKPMTVVEAATQMELLGHSFFFFLNSATQEHNVLYRRRDGNYGLIEPESA